MTDPVDLNAKRWESDTNPTDHKPIDALRAAIRNIESGKLNPRHICIVYSDTNTGTGYFQAGEFEYFASIGMLTRCIQIMGTD